MFNTSERSEISISELLSMNELSDEFIFNCWYDWFCKNKALVGRGKRLLTKFKQIAKNTTKFDKSKSYLWFKNNCPLYGDGKLYDDFRISDIETGDVIYTITPRNPYGHSTVYGRENKFEKPLVNGTWKDVKNFFKGE